MSLEIIRIPEIVEYGTGFTSRWKCAWLPIIWKMQSDLFPVNSVDAGLTIASVADNGEGLAEFTCTANHLLLRFDWVNVTSSTVDDYEGIRQLVEVSAANIFTLNIPFNATATGTAKKYYNNYHAIIEVYGGLPSGHEFEALDPSSLTASVKIFFDSNNIAVVDLKRIAQTLINNIFDNNIPSWPNVLNFWDQTEILIKESFDSSTGTAISTTERYACIKDGGFVTGADWSNEGTGASWTFGSDQANVSLDEAGDNDSKELTQTIQGDALARFSITVTSTFTHTSGTPTVRLRAVIGGTTINVQGSTTSELTLTNTVIGLTVDALGVFSLEADITAGSGTDTVDIVIDNVQVCIGLANKVVNSKLDFRNGRGGNMFDYIARSIVTPANFMTAFKRPTLFINEYFSLSIILDDLSISPVVVLLQEDISGNEVANIIQESIDDQDKGVYQLRLDQLGINSDTRILKAFLATQDTIITENFDSDTDWDVRGTSSIAAGVLNLEPGIGNRVVNEPTLVITAGTTYDVEINITNIDGSNIQLNTNSVGDTSIEFQIGSNMTTSGVHIFRHTFGVGQIFVVWNNATGTTSPTITSITFTPLAGESEAITEILCIDYNQECASQEIYLMWLNQFGGWDFWKFNAEKDYGTEFTDSQRTEKNIYDNWPESYNKESLREEARIKGFKTITVRSQHLTSAQADSIGGIKASMHVIWIKEGLTLSDKVTVLVDKSSFQRFNETDQLHTISFIIRQTDDIATQSN